MPRVDVGMFQYRAWVQTPGYAPWSPGQLGGANEFVANALAQGDRPVGTTIRIERVRTVNRAHLKPRRGSFGVWMPYRSYVVGEDGSVRRTDK
jgi:hypothetical protein